MLPSAPQSNVKNLGTKCAGPIIHCTSARPNKRLRVWSYYNVCCMHPHNYINPPALTAHRNIEIDVLGLPFKHAHISTLAYFFVIFYFLGMGAVFFSNWASDCNAFVVSIVSSTVLLHSIYMMTYTRYILHWT